MKKRLFSWLLVLAMVLSLMPTVAFAEGTTPDPTDLINESFAGKYTANSYVTSHENADGETILVLDTDHCTAANSNIGHMKSGYLGLRTKGAGCKTRAVTAWELAGSYEIEVVFMSGGTATTNNSFILPGILVNGAEYELVFDCASTGITVSGTQVLESGWTITGADYLTTVKITVDGDNGTVTTLVTQSETTLVNYTLNEDNGLTIGNSKFAMQAISSGTSNGWLYCSTIKVACNHAAGSKTEVPETAATCTSDGCTAGTICADCDTAYEGFETITALGHDWDEGTVAEGVITYSCQRDGCTETKTEELGLASVDLINESYDKYTANSANAYVFNHKNDAGEIILAQDLEHSTTEAANIGEMKAGYLGLRAKGVTVRAATTRELAGSYEIEVNFMGSGAADTNSFILPGVKINDAEYELVFNLTSGAITVSGTEVAAEGWATATSTNLKITVDGDNNTVTTVVTQNENTWTAEADADDGLTIGAGKFAMQAVGSGTSNGWLYCSTLRVTCNHAEVAKTDVTEQEATCGEAGHTAGTICVGCDTAYEGYESIPATGDHTWEVTFGENGETIFNCSGCDATKTIENPNPVLFEQDFASYDPETDTALVKDTEYWTDAAASVTDGVLNLGTTSTSGKARLNTADSFGGKYNVEILIKGDGKTTDGAYSIIHMPGIKATWSKGENKTYQVFFRASNGIQLRPGATTLKTLAAAANYSDTTWTKVSVDVDQYANTVFTQVYQNDARLGWSKLQDEVTSVSIDDTTIGVDVRGGGTATDHTSYVDYIKVTCLHGDTVTVAAQQPTHNTVGWGEYQVCFDCGAKIGYEETSVPTQDGKVFAGWYTDEANTTPCTADECTGDCHAKFVNAATLQTKVQLSANTTAESTSTKLRLVSTVDSLNYKKAGFTVNGTDIEITKVYGKIVGTDGTDQLGYLPTDISEDAYAFATVTLTGFVQTEEENNFGTEFTVTAWWETLDGVKVYGETRTESILTIIEKVAAN